MGDYPKSLVVKSAVGFGELSKYFVKGVGLVKMVFRGISPQENGSFVVTSSLISLNRGDPKRSIKYRFKEEKKALPVKPIPLSKKAEKSKLVAIPHVSGNAAIKIDSSHRGQIRTWPRSLPRVDSTSKK